MESPRSNWIGADAIPRNDPGSSAIDRSAISL
jgi:hypothetical protein